MAIWSAFTNAIGGAFKNLGDVFGGDPNQSFMDRMGKGMSAAWDIAAKAPADAIGMIPSVAGDAWKGFANVDQRVYTDLISHPASDFLQMQNKALYAFNAGGFSGLYHQVTNPHDFFIDSWNESSHFSPGQEIVLTANNINQAHNPLVRVLGQALPPITTVNGIEALGSIGGNTQWFHNKEIDPSNIQAVTNTVDGNSWGNHLASGAFDATLRWYVDPTSKVLKTGTTALKALKNNPVKSTGDIERVMAQQKTQRFVNWTMGKSAAEIAEHPVLRKSAYRWTIANALSGSQSLDESNALFRTLLGDKRAYEEVLATNQGLAFRQANLLAPQQIMERFALASGDVGHVQQWLQPVEKSKAVAARAQLNSNMARFNDVLSAAGSLMDRTSSSALAELSAQARTGLKYATIRSVDKSGFLQPARLVSNIQDHAYNVPIRIYHALTDRPAMGFINHADDSAPDQVRSWLNKSKVLTPEEKLDYTQRYANMDRGQRASGWTKIEDEVYGKVADKYGIDPSDMASILNQTRMRQGFYANGAKSGAYGVINTPTGQALHLLATGNGEIIAHPDLITQLQQGAVPMSNLVDIERSLNNMDKSGVLNTILQSTNARNVLTNTLDRVYGIWKPLSLMSMHRAYNHIGDDLLRGAAKLGGMTTVSNATEGAANFLRNRLSPLTKNMWVKNQEGQYDQLVATAKSQAHGLAAQALDQKTRMKAGEIIPKANQVTTQDVLKAHQRYRDLADPANRPVFIQPKYRLGTGSFIVPGTNIRVEEAFGGPNSDYLRQLTSSEQFFQSQINDTAHNMYQSLMSNTSGPGFTVIYPSDDLNAWTKAYLHYVNNQLRPDPVAKALIQGKDPAVVEKWLSDSPQGQQYMRMLHKADTHAQVQAVADHVNKYLPTQQLRDAAMSGRGVKTADINRTWHTASQMPEVNGNLNLLMHGGHPAVLSLKNTTNKLLKLTGTLPDDIMVRHPIFNELYKSRVSQAIRTAADQAPMGKMTTAEIGRLQNMAMTQARKDLQNLVYDTSRFNDAGHMLRFISPFFNAWFNALSSWSSLFAQNPELLARTAIAKNAIWGNPLAVDTSTGEKATPDTPLSNLAIVAHMPTGMAKALGASDLTEVPINANTLLSPTYADSIGNPGFGPLVQVPVNQLAKQSPSIAEDPMVATILGQRITANSLQSLIPSAATQTLGMLGLAGLTGQSSDALNRASLAWSIYQEQMYDYQSGARSTPPNLKDIQGQTAYVSALDAVVNRLSPLGFKPQAAHQFYVDQYRNMLSNDPKNAQQDFVKKYGEQAYIFTQSLGKNTAGVPATANGIKAYDKYKGLIADNPDLAPVIIGVQGAGNFDEMAYQWEVANGLRTYQTPEEAAKAANVGQGWFNYQQTMAKINIVLANRGLTSINQSGAKDLKQFRDAYVAATNDPTSPYYNPDFYSNYGAYNKNAYMQRIQALEKVASDPALLSNPVRTDIRGLNAYFQYRYQAQQYMKGRSSTSIKSADNRDVANWFDYNVAQLVQDNTQFGELYQRYLKDDDLTQP